MNVTALFGSPIAELAYRLEALPGGSLRRATVLVPGERIAHALRRELCLVRHNPGALAGVSFIRPAAYAQQCLAAAGRVRIAGWEAQRQGRILSLLESGALAGKLRYFDPEQLSAGHGYAEALARAISDLEDAGLSSDALATVASELQGDALAGHRLADVATVWRLADEPQGDHRTSAQLLAEAAALVGVAPGNPSSISTSPSIPHSQRGTEGDSSSGQLSFDDLFSGAESVPHDDDRERRHPDAPVFALCAESPPVVLLRFFESIPGLNVLLQDARPVRTGAHRWREVLGVDAAIPTAHGESELDLLQRYLFEVPDELSRPERPRSLGPDGSVELEQHAGIDDEVEAAAAWVAARVAGGTPLERIAIAVPEKGAYESLLVDRLSRVSGGGDAKPIASYVAGGESMAASPAGVRVLALLECLRSGMDYAATLRVIPAVRRAGQTPDTSATRLSPSRVAHAVNQAGVAGGGAGDREGIRDWSRRLGRFRDRQKRIVADAEAAAAAGAAPGRAVAHRAALAGRWLGDMEPLLPAIESLQTLSEMLIDQASFAAFWPELRGFLGTHYLMPPDPANLPALLDTFVEPMLSTEVMGELDAASGLRWLAASLQSQRRAIGRFGEPAVFIGTPAQVAGLSFDAVRVVGLTEGGLPRTPHDDPIVPDDLRVVLEERARAVQPDVTVPRMADRVLDDIHGVFRAVAGATEQVTLSVPRQWIDRSEREASGIVLEAAAALGRQSPLLTKEGARGRFEKVPATTDEGDVPTAGRLRSLYFVHGNAVSAGARAQTCISARAGLTRDPRDAGARAIVHPAFWNEPPAVALKGIRARFDAQALPDLSAVDGSLGEIWNERTPMGTAERPLSASGVGMLLSCPFRFLMQRILHFDDREVQPATDAVAPMYYGSAFHRAAERLYREAGSELCHRNGDLDLWLRRAGEIAAEEMQALCEVYPLRGREALAREEGRLAEQLRCLVRDEWGRESRTFVGTEVGFGEAVPVPLDVGDEVLHFRGAIDRVDQFDDSSLSVRDIKTGRVRDLAEEEVNATRDLQIAIYTRVAETLALGEGEAPRRVVEASYVHPSVGQEPERCFRGAQLEGLRTRADGWLQVAAAVLRKGAFVRTPNPDDCQNCPFVPVCGNRAQAMAHAKLSALSPTDDLGAFLALKQEAKFDE